MDKRMQFFDYDVTQQSYFTRFFTEKLLVNRAVELLQARLDTHKPISTTLFLTNGWCSMVQSANEIDKPLFRDIEFCIELNDLSDKQIERIIRRAGFFLALRCSPDECLSQIENPLLFMNWALRALASFFEKKSFEVIYSLERPYFPGKGIYFFSHSTKSRYLFLETLKYMSNIPVENRESLSGRRVCYIQQKIEELLITQKSVTGEPFQEARLAEKKDKLNILVREMLMCCREYFVK